MRITFLIVIWALCMVGSTTASDHISEDMQMMEFGEIVINASSTIGNQGETACIDFTVDNFINVQTLQFSIHFDPTIVEPICPPTQFGLLGLMGNNFNCNNIEEGFIRMVWVDPNSGLDCGVTLDDGSEVFTICFDVIGQPGRTTPVYVADDQLDIEYSQIIDCDDIDNFLTFNEITSNRGEIEVSCGDLSVFADVCDSAPGQDNGSITFYGCGGTGPYNYDFNGGQATGTSDAIEDIVVTDLSPGAYTIIVTDASGGMETIDVTVGQNNPITVDYNVIPPSCFTQDNGSIEITDINGGSPNYTVQWDNFQFDNPEYDDLSNGTYGLTVTDDRGCQFKEMIEVRVDTLRVMAEILDQPTCPGALNGTVRITATGGTPYPGGEYILNSAGPTVEFIDMNAGDGVYPFVAEDNGRSTCRVRDTIIIEPLGNISVDIEPQDVLCFGTNTGSVFATASGSTNFAFSLVDEDGNPPPFGVTSPQTYMSDSLAPGFWFLRVRDALNDGCEINEMFEIREAASALVVSKDSLNPSCQGDDGTITITAEGGTVAADYTFLWEDGASGSMRTGLEGGNYQVSVTDDNGCEEILVIDLAPGGELQVEATLVQGVTCEFPDQGSVMVEVINQGNFSYEWTTIDGSPITGETTLTGLSSGSYIVVVTDTDFACVATDTVIVPNPSDIQIEVNYTLPSCPFESFNNGSIGITKITGTGDLTFLWENSQSGSVLGGLIAGNYQVLISDELGCTLDTTLTLDNPASIDVVVDNVLGVNCTGVANGQAMAVASGGTVDNGQYNFLWSSAPDDVDFNVSMSSADALPAGRQFLVVTDASCPSDTIFFDVPDIDTLTIDLDNSSLNMPQCFSDCNGSITAQATGGNPASYSYQWLFDGSTDETLSDICAGLYRVEITDANGCSRVDSVLLEQPDSLALSINISETIDLNCFNIGEGAIGIDVEGGTPDFSYNWTDNVSSTSLAENLGDGTYFVEVTDDRGCQEVISYTLTSPEPIVATVPQPASPDCFGGRSCITVTDAMGGVGNNFTFTVNRGLRFPLDSCVEVFAGMYNVTVFDSAGCSEEYTVDIDQPDEIKVDLGADVVVSLGESSEPINAVIESVFNIDSIFWSPIEDLICQTADCQVVTITPTQDRMYGITIIDENGCTAEDEIMVRVDRRRNVHAPNIFSPNGDGFNDVFQLAAGPGVENIEYLQIFDRWGNPVYIQENYLPESTIVSGWDGTYNARSAIEGVYVYVAQARFIDGETVRFKGSVTLLR